MNDQELRQIVRQALAKHGAAQSPESRVQSPGSRVQGPESRVRSSVQFVPESVPFGSHVSHAMYSQLVNSSGACVIEEHASCTHCGYCKSHGH